jgi:hypothetical protein
VFFDVSLDGHKVLVDEGRDFRISVRLGLQPSTCASSRGGAEVNEQRFLRRLTFDQRRVRILVPLHTHFFDPPKSEIYEPESPDIANRVPVTEAYGSPCSFLNCQNPVSLSADFAGTCARAREVYKGDDLGQFKSCPHTKSDVTVFAQPISFTSPQMVFRKAVTPGGTMLITIKLPFKGRGRPGWARAFTMQPPAMW